MILAELVTINENGRRFLFILMGVFVLLLLTFFINLILLIVNVVKGKKPDNQANPKYKKRILIHSVITGTAFISMAVILLLL